MLNDSDKMLIKDNVKRSMDILSEDFDVEIMDEINACEMDLKLAGIESSKSPLYEKAVIFYCKAYLRPDSNFERYLKAFERLSNKMALDKTSTSEVT